MRQAFQAAILFTISFSFLLLSSGCISNIAPQDRLNSTILFNVSAYIDRLPLPLNRPDPCTCMVCTQESPSFISYWWYKLNPFKSKLIENDLVSSQCHFLACNASIYTNTLADYNETKGVWGKCTVGGKDLSCAPRFFMIGQGTTTSDFSLAQRYCAGRLNMPVIWALQKTEDMPPSPPKPSILMCYLAKSQMPIVVWKSGGKFVGGAAYDSMLLSYNNLSADPKIEGPVMVTTEANIDPYIASPTGEKTLNIALLQNIKSQLDSIRANCPKCLSVLALKPMFNDSSPDIPDLCPLDYFLKFQSTDPNAPEDPFGCASKYPSGYSHSSRPAATIGFSDEIDMVGVAFLANANPNLTSCTPMGDIARHQLYSRKILSNFQKPSVWYAVGIAPTITSSPSCPKFSESSVADSYDQMLTSIAGDVSDGVIGVAAYKFLGTGIQPGKPASIQLPLPCAAINQKIFSTSLPSLAEISEGSQITSDDGMQNVFVKNITSLSAGQTFFYDDAGINYIAWLDGNSVSINQTEKDCSNFGFSSSDGTLKKEMAYSWFSDCQYYFTNHGPIFTSSLSSLSGVLPGATIYSRDSTLYVTVQSINSSSSSEIIFYASDGMKYSARLDGSQVEVMDMPFVGGATQEPLMFSTNGAGGTCSAFQEGGAKMLYRSPLAQSARTQGLDLPLDPALQKSISQMQCGNCLSPVPMPKAFCDAQPLIPASSGISMRSAACYQYPEMDDAFLQKELDPVMMRALAAGESGLGNGVDSGAGAPACAISNSQNPNNWCGDANAKAAKQPSALASYATNYCTADVISTRAQAIIDSNGGVCALGVFQCIDSPSATYNPFNPYDSATCGARQFKEMAGRYNDMLSQLRSFRQLNPTLPANDIKQGGMGESELEWYAAWLASYHYSGMGAASISMLQGYQQADSSDNVVKYMVRQLEQYCAQLKQNNPNALCYPYYGTAFILRYNDAIDKCGNGCPYMDCSAQ